MKVSQDRNTIYFTILLLAIATMSITVNVDHRELPAQAQELVRILHDVNFYGVDYQNEWKVITVFIGGNDLCEYCHESVSSLTLTGISIRLKAFKNPH